MTEAFIGLGSNLERPEAQLLRAVTLLEALPETTVGRVSPAYWTEPWGLTEQPEFLNAVVRVETALPARSLLESLLSIENRQGRFRDPERRWAPRVLDLDLLVFGGEQIDEAGLKVPHPRLAERPFVVIPLADLAPELIIPGLGTAKVLASKMNRSGLRRADVDLHEGIGKPITGIRGEQLK